MNVNINTLITYDLVAFPGFKNASLINDEELKQKKILEDMEKRNKILDELLKED